MAWRKAPPELVALFDGVLPAGGRLERRQMFGYPAAFLGGYLVAGLHQESFILRLGAAERARAIGEHGATKFEPRAGREMANFVCLPGAVLADRDALQAWIAAAIAHAETLPAKAKKPVAAARRRAQSGGAG